MRRSEKEKAKLVEEWITSGKSRTAWCKAQGISVKTLKLWIEKLNTGENGRMKNEPVIAEAKVKFSGDCTNIADEVRIRVPVKGKVFEIYCASEKSALRNVLEAVAECL
jgi:transposase-like protein